MQKPHFCFFCFISHRLCCHLTHRQIWARAATKTSLKPNFRGIWEPPSLLYKAHFQASGTKSGLRGVQWPAAGLGKPGSALGRCLWSAQIWRGRQELKWLCKEFLDTKRKRLKALCFLFLVSLEKKGAFSCSPPAPVRVLSPAKGCACQGAGEQASPFQNTKTVQPAVTGQLGKAEFEFWPSHVLGPLRERQSLKLKGLVFILQGIWLHPWSRLAISGQGYSDRTWHLQQQGKMNKRKVRTKYYVFSEKIQCRNSSFQKIPISVSNLGPNTVARHTQPKTLHGTYLPYFQTSTIQHRRR